jgi:hypothetical protein
MSENRVTKLLDLVKASAAEEPVIYTVLQVLDELSQMTESEGRLFFEALRERRLRARKPIPLGAK